MKYLVLILFIIGSGANFSTAANQENKPHFHQIEGKQQKVTIAFSFSEKIREEFIRLFQTTLGYLIETNPTDKSIVIANQNTPVEDINVFVAIDHSLEHLPSLTHLENQGHDIKNTYSFHSMVSPKPGHQIQKITILSDKLIYKEENSLLVYNPRLPADLLVTIGQELFGGLLGQFATKQPSSKIQPLEEINRHIRNLEITIDWLETLTNSHQNIAADTRADLKESLNKKKKLLVEIKLVRFDYVDSLSCQQAVPTPNKGKNKKPTLH